MLIAYTKGQLIDRLLSVMDRLDSGSEVRIDLGQIIKDIRDDFYDPQLRPYRDASPRFEANAAFQSVRIEAPPSIPIPPGYEVVIRKAQ